MGEKVTGEVTALGAAHGLQMSINSRRLLSSPFLLFSGLPFFDDDYTTVAGIRPAITCPNARLERTRLGYQPSPILNVKLPLIPRATIPGSTSIATSSAT